jgi:vanillate O-demethylase monooxygenase subunit
MDLTHIPFIHRKTIGGGVVMEQVGATMHVNRTDRGVHYVRWMENIVPPPTYVKGAKFQEGARVDRWQDFEFVAPGSVIQWSGALEHGRNARANREQPGGFQLRLYHGATPETEQSCHYFWTPANGYRQDEPEATEQLYKEIAYTFTEDLSYLETQSARLLEFPDRTLVDVKHDGPRIHARRVVERMVRAETGDAALAAE